MRKKYCVGASVASTGALAFTLADTPTRRRICFYLSAVTRRFASGASIARGNPPPKSAAVALAHYIGQKPGGDAAPTLFCKEKFTKVKVIDWEERKQKRLRFG